MSETLQYREKLQVVEARLFDGDSAEMMDVVSWVRSHGYVWYDMFTPAPSKGVTLDQTSGFLIISNSNGIASAQKGFYLVKSADGTITPWRPSVFLATYEIDPGPEAEDEEESPDFELPETQLPSE